MGVLGELGGSLKRGSNGRPFAGAGGFNTRSAPPGENAIDGGVPLFAKKRCSTTHFLRVTEWDKIKGD